MIRKGSYENMDNSPTAHPLVAIKMPADETEEQKKERERKALEEQKKELEEKKRRLYNPFNETYFNDQGFYTKVCDTYETARNKEQAEIAKRKAEKLKNGGKVEEDGKEENKGTVKWRECETRQRLEEIKNKIKGAGDDPLITLMTTTYDQYQVLLDEFPSAKLNDVFVEHLSEFVGILLEEDNTGVSKYGFPLDPEKEKYKKNNLEVRDPYNNKKGAGCSILHLAAHRNLCQIVNKFLTLYPNTIVWTDFPEDKKNQRSRLPVEIALDAEKDDVCQLLMSRMLNERVRNLFKARNDKDSAKYTLAKLVTKGKMEKTVIAVLDSCLNPSMPFLKEYTDEKKEDDAEEEIWASVPTIPLRYNFFFEILEGNYQGDFIGKSEGEFHRNFAITSPSGLQMITNTVSKESAAKHPIRHMVVRQLVRQKWEDYGKKTVIIQGCFYLFYLISLSIGLFFGAQTKDPTKYGDAFSISRGVFEVLSVLFTMFYMLVEVGQWTKEISAKCCDQYGSYLPWLRILDPFKVLYFMALLGIFSMVPCQLLGYQVPARSIATVCYPIIFMQISDYFPLSLDYGTYANTFKEIVKVDIKQFVVIISFVVMAFAGSIYMAMAASNSFDDNFKNFWHVLLQELRAMLEGKEFSDSYAQYHFLLTILIVISMFFIIIVMGNVLIGQISDRYTAAKGIATIQYDIDKAKLLVNIERSWFPCLRNQRRSNYKEGLYVNNAELVSDLIKDWKTYFADDDTLQSDVNKLMEKKILKKSPLSM